MSSGDIDTILRRLEQNAAAQADVIGELRIQLAALPAEAPSSVALTMVATLLDRVCAGLEAAPLTQALATTAIELLPGSQGAISRSSDSGDSQIVCIWSGDSIWNLGAPPAPTELLERIAGQPNDAAVRLPLSFLGVGTGELRVWPGNSPYSQSDTRIRLLALCAGIGLGGLLLKSRINQRSVRDALTGLFNRRYMEDTLVRELHRARRNMTPLGLVMIDIDRLDHDSQETMSPRTLEAVGGLLQASFRASDICCRIDTRRFAVVLPDASLADTLQRTRDVLNAIAELSLPHREPETRNIAACAGVAALPEHADSAESLILASEAALFMAHSGGPGTACVAEKIN